MGAIWGGEGLEIGALASWRDSGWSNGRQEVRGQAAWLYGGEKRGEVGGDEGKERGRGTEGAENVNTNEFVSRGGLEERESAAS
jgi:hypothetical protein